MSRHQPWCQGATGGAWTRCAGPRVDVWHGLPTAAVACQRHADENLSLVVRGHTHAITASAESDRH